MTTSNHNRAFNWEHTTSQRMSSVLTADVGDRATKWRVDEVLRALVRIEAEDDRRALAHAEPTEPKRRKGLRRRTSTVTASNSPGS
jgi:hypothetical protein